MSRFRGAFALVAVCCGCSGSGGGTPDGASEVECESFTGPDAPGVEVSAMDLVSGKLPFDWCLPDSPPDADCHASKRDPESESIALALEIALAQIERHPVAEMAWNWEEAVLMVGLAELYDVTGRQEVLDYYKAWMDMHIESGFVMGSSDTCAPAAVAVALYRQTGDPDGRYKAVVERALAYLSEEALRTQEGGISHLGTLDLRTLWVDSLFMFGGVLYGWGEVSGDTEVLDEYGFQFDLFAQLMQDDTGFYVHAYNWIMKQTPGVYWGRGNGWVAAAGSMYHRILVNRGEHRPTLETALSALLDAARGAQDSETGLWWTIMSRPGEIYLETSAAALFAFGMARSWRYGLVGDEYLDSISLAMHGVLDRIETGEDGKPLVTGISGPTSADKYEEYARVPLEDDLGYGVGAVLLALIETSGLPPSIGNQSFRQ